MRSFNVFSNDGGDYRAVKRGWCWPAFFFGSIWALFSGLWLAAFLLLPIEFIFSVVGNSANGSFDPYESYDETTRLVALAIFSIPLAIRVVLGAVGNAWRDSKLRKLGFLYVGRVKADGKAHAISLCKAASSEASRQHLNPVTEEVASTKTQSEIEQIIANANPSVTEDIRRWIGEQGGTKATLQGFPPHWLGWMIAALSILAVADMPYGYYQLLRLLVAGYCGYLAALYFICRLSAWAWTFAFIALLYNPVFVITMSKDFHALVNLMVAAAVAWEIKKLRKVSIASSSNMATP